MHEETCLNFFVYGTLKRGEVRERLWPHSPATIFPATITGSLYDLGDYPALVLAGSDQILGEVWSFQREDFSQILSALDDIEGYPFFYKRSIEKCEDAANQSIQAWVYTYAKEENLISKRKVVANREGFCKWSNPTAQSDS